ncbi:uncharacterized protein [Triticum aestivum]|uniref:uncharacterized protein n=1 Tax=Triticum aestivum TaxID=4565 RepID=UPI001ABC35FE|nr:uncharacterized protein LOC120975792 [Aegilops tauschii subsp. strangulata]XP_044354548.1 uncharacterized protein LOC123076272 [Triticum aestivum]
MRCSRTAEPAATKKTHDHELPELPPIPADGRTHLFPPASASAGDATAAHPQYVAPPPHHPRLQLGVLLLELVSMQQRASGTPSSLTQTEERTTLALQSIIRCCKVGSLIFGIRKNG